MSKPSENASSEGTSDGSSSQQQLMDATQSMQEMQASFDLQIEQAEDDGVSYDVGDDEQQAP